MINDIGTLLSVWAHPDDETYLCGGLMARAARAGSRVVCVTATRGELGSPDEQRWPPGAALAAVRTRELERALEELHISEHLWLDYPDGGCAQIDDDEASGRLAQIVADVGPDTILTFGPDGITGHPDHISVGRWTTAAFAEAARPKAALAYATYTPEFLARFREPLDSIGAFLGNEPPCTDRADLFLHERLTGELLEVKMRAIGHQTSQVEPLIAALGIELLREGLAEEFFRAAVGAWP